jgi:acetyl-CoA C-acetyltransferase
MREAVIVSTARTGIGRAFKGSLNHTKSPSLLGHVIAQAVQRAGIEGSEVEDVVMGTVLTSGTAGMNLASVMPPWLQACLSQHQVKPWTANAHQV